MYQLTNYSVPELVTGPTAEPLTLPEAKKQLEIASTDTSHDDHLARLIVVAKEQFEHDTDSFLCFQTWRVRYSSLEDCMVLPKSPIQSITSIAYYNSSNVSTTLATSVYQLDTSKNSLRLAYNQDWPGSVDRWDAFTITYVVGYSADSFSVPAIAKQAMLLLIGHYFENRDMLVANMSLKGNVFELRAYEALIARFVRSSYP